MPSEKAREALRLMDRYTYRSTMPGKLLLQIAQDLDKGVDYWEYETSRGNIVYAVKVDWEDEATGEKGFSIRFESDIYRD